MLLKRLIALSLLLSTLLLSACSQAPTRQQQLNRFLDESEHLIVYYALPMTPDSQLSAIHMDHETKKLQRAYNPEQENLRVIHHLMQNLPALEDGEVVRKDQWKTLRSPDLDPNTLVWFIDLRAQANYSRFPLKLDHFRITYSLFAKVIPLGQFLAGNATLALSSTLWQNVCQYKAEDGKFFSVKEWTQNDSERLQKSLQHMRETCGSELAKAL